MGKLDATIDGVVLETAALIDVVRAHGAIVQVRPTLSGLQMGDNLADGVIPRVPTRSNSRSVDEQR